MRIDFQIAAHFGQQVTPNFLLPIPQGGEIIAEVHSPVATFAPVR